MQTRRMTEGRVGPALIRFAGPYLMSSFLQALYGAADLFVVGRFTGSAAVSAVSTGSQVMQMITGLMLGISMGGTVLIGRRVGEGDPEGMARAIGTLSMLLGLVALVLAPAVALFSRGAARLMRTPAEAMEMARGYIFICAVGIPFIIGYNAVSGIFRGLGDARTPVLFIAVACLVNVGADFYLVGGLGMGAQGAALATVAAQGISFICALIYMKKRGFDFPLGRRHFRLEGRATRAILRLGVPLAAQDALVSLSFLIITAIINGLGLVASASVGVVEKIITFAMLPPSAFASAVATMTAQNEGAGLHQRALKGLKCGIGYSLAFGLAVCLFAQWRPQSLTAIFSGDRLVIEAAAGYLRAYAIDCIFVAFVFNLNAYFNGCGRSVISLAHSLAATFLARIPLSYLFSRLGGASLYPMGLAAPLASLMSIAILAVYFLYSRRKGPEN